MSTSPSSFTLPAPRRLALAAACAAAVLLAGCSRQELYSQLTERQANEMVAALRSANIDAEKLSQEGRFSVLTASGDFSRAVQVLNAQGLPRETFDTMGKVFKREGFVSSPLEEHARLLHAMSQEISNTLGNIDGVVTARVHLVVPARHPLADKPQPAAASVFIKHRPDRDLSAQVAQIKALVVNSVEGLAYDNVTVALFPADAMPGDPAAPGRSGAGASLPSGAKAGGPSAAAPASPLEAPLLTGGLAGALALAGGAVLWWRRRGQPGAASTTTVRALSASAPGPETADLSDGRLARQRRKVESS